MILKTRKKNHREVKAPGSCSSSSSRVWEKTWPRLSHPQIRGCAEEKKGWFLKTRHCCSRVHCEPVAYRAAYWLKKKCTWHYAAWMKSWMLCVGVSAVIWDRKSPPRFPPVGCGGAVRSFCSTPLFAYPSKTRRQTHPALTLIYLPFFHLHLSVCLSVCLSAWSYSSHTRLGADRLLIVPVVMYPW